jgi:hypothetical protein
MGGIELQLCNRNKNNTLERQNIMNKAITKAVAFALRQLAKQAETFALDLPTFALEGDDLKAYTALKNAGVDGMADDIETKARKAFEKEHGDTEAAFKSALFTLLQDGVKDIFDTHGLSKATRRAKSDILTASQITKEQCEEALKRRAEGVPLSQVSREMGSDPMAQNLRNAILRELGQDELDKANESAKAKKGGA